MCECLCVSVYVYINLVTLIDNYDWEYVICYVICITLHAILINIIYQSINPQDSVSMYCAQDSNDQSL